MHAYLSFIKKSVLLVFGKQEHVYEVDQNAGCLVGVGRCVHHPLKNHHEHQVSKQAQHEHQLRYQDQKYGAILLKVPGHKREQERESHTNLKKVRLQSCAAGVLTHIVSPQHL